MAIFKCVGYFNFHMPEGSCFAAFLPFFTWSHSAQRNNKEKASRQTHTQETTKLTKENNVRTKHKWKHAECDHLKKGEKSSEAESFRHMKIKISYTLEDGHVGRNM
jgi:hypothetical protein